MHLPPLLRGPSSYAALVAGLLLSGATPSVALELGFEGRVLVQSSDNVEFANKGEEEEGTLGFGTIGVFGEQAGTRLRVGFSGELDTRKQLDDSDDEWDTLTRFVGAAEYDITPRTFSWYVGDILGGVRVDDGTQSITDFDTVTRNVFVTGPSFEFPVSTDSRFDARLLYVNQTEEGEELETLYNGFFQFERERIEGRRIGARLTDVYTVSPDEDLDSDFNRVSASAYIEREFPTWSWGVELGGTRYDTEEVSLNGVLAILSAERRLSRESTIGVTLRRDTNDQTLGTVEGLIEDGTALQQDADGIYDETNLELNYGFQSAATSVDVGIGVTDVDYRLLAESSSLGELADEEDQLQSYAYAYLSGALTSRLRYELGLSYRNESFDNRDDDTNSVLGSAVALYRLSRSFEVEASYYFDTSEGVESTIIDGARINEDIDRAENRVGLGIRWAPPSRASQDLTIELKSLIQ